MPSSPLVHLKRAFGWNLGSMLPSPEESAALVAAGVLDPAVQRYATWRRSLLLIALVPTLASLVLAAIDMLEEDFGDFTIFGLGIEGLGVLAAAVLPFACFQGVRSWTRPGTGSGLLRASWIVAFALPFVRALLPVGAIFHVHEPEMPTAVAGLDLAAVLDAEKAAKLVALKDMAMEFVLSGGTYLLLFPAVLSLIPGAVNGCLRIKSLLPAAQLPGWLLVCAAPVFLLFWLIILVVANEAARSPLLVFGVILWAGSPIWFSIRGRVFVQSQITPEDAAKIARVKRVVGLLALAGVALMVTFILSVKVAGLNVVGVHHDTAVSTKLDEMRAQDDEMTLDDVSRAFADSDSFLYAFDLSSCRMIVDILAKLLLVTAVFADLILRATLSAWKNDRALRAKSEASGYDASAGAIAAALSPRGNAAP